MGTTALFAELVVGGIQTLSWVVLLAMTALGPARVAPALEASSLNAVVALAFAYTLGVVFDRVWDWVLDATGLQKRLRGEAGAEPASELDQRRRALYKADPKLAVEFIHYHRSRMRVARASLFNFALITISGLALVGTHFGGVQTTEFALVGVAGCAMCVASWLALRKLSRSHDQVVEVVTPE